MIYLEFRNRNEAYAFKFAKEFHAGQKRKNTGEEYITHPLKVYKILRFVTQDDDVLCAALLHDVVEDTEVSYDDLKSSFGEKVTNIVKEVTKDKAGRFHLKTRNGLMVKLADMLHNISNSTDEEYIQKKIRFTEKQMD